MTDGKDLPEDSSGSMASSSGRHESREGSFQTGIYSRRGKEAGIS